MSTMRTPTPEEVAWHVRNAQRLRSQVIGSALRAGARRLRAAGAQAARAVCGAGQGSEATAALRSPLTAMRCAAEILRDNPDLPPAERSRFLQVLLAEERRMEELVAGLLEGRKLGASGH